MRPSRHGRPTDNSRTRPRSTAGRRCSSTDLDGTAARRLTDGTGDAAAAWSPDGTQIAFVRGNEIALLTVASGEVRTLGTGGDPAWSPDGTTIYAWQTS